ncbi:SDR family NAD(P)-dependent oxidoreductase [Streptomyces griseus]|uniref:SDR family NAD(P)-dependent oxidoreductase n=1 Tax=Streptomyces griseus TaxID=1911 RepID=UPI000691EF89|nr:SDR family NAD(P)-dependent oxidoreductase [Streptomyces griseus]
MTTSTQDAGIGETPAKEAKTASERNRPGCDLVNNPCISKGSTALDVTDEEWHQVLDANLNGVWRCARNVGGQMVARGIGTLVNVGSMYAMNVNRPRWQSAYLAS